MKDDDAEDVELGTQPGDEFATAPADELKLQSPSQSDDSVDKRIVDEHVLALKAANKYRRALVVWTLRTVAGLTVAATFFMLLYVIAQWGEIDASVMIAYFVSVVAETIGILYVIARYLFPSSGPKS